jgi:hypothetical protein
MADRILVDLGWVLGLSDDISATTGRLRTDTDTTASIESAPDVNDGLRNLLDDCDERRGALADVLTSVEEALQSIHDSFTGTEEELVAALEEEG